MRDKISSAPGCADAFDPNSISLAEALDKIQQRVRPVLACERLPIRDCLGRVNNEAVKSPHNVPPLPNSAMDGYAIAIASLDQGVISELEDIGTAYAGTPFDGSCGPGQCVRIMTGALIPDGADAVVMQEQTEINAAGKVRIDSDHRVGENIRQAGEDVRQDEIVVEAGARLSPADLGVLASLGLGQLQVKRKPVVAFFSTGDELVPVGTPLEPGKIYDSNRYSLHGMLSNMAVDIIDLGVVRDNLDSMREVLTKASTQADLIISTGGVSVGEADFIKPALADLGTTEFWKIAIKPGRPLTFGQINASIFMGLPGNPVSVFATFCLFVCPVIQIMQGRGWRKPIALPVTADFDWPKPDSRREFLRARLATDTDNQTLVQIYPNQDSGVLTSTVWADGFVEIAENQTVRAGEMVNYLPFVQFFN